MNSTKSGELKELEKRLSRKRKERSEEKIKEILKKKEVDYDTVTTILDIFRKSKFQWKKEHFDVFESRSNEFRGKELPDNNRECVMLGVRLGTMRSKIIYNLKGLQITEKQKHDIDELIWNFIWYQWREAKTINDFVSQENNNSTKKVKDSS